MKKGKLLLLPIALAFSSFLVRADFISGMEKGANDLISLISAFFGPFLGAVLGQGATADFFFVKILLLILLVVVIRFALLRVPQFQNQRGILIIVPVIISILAVRFISENQLTQGILLPTGVLGVALISILPFMIYFYFVFHSGMTGGGRRVAWIFFGIVSVVLWIYRSGDISAAGNWIYGATLAAAILSLLFDKSIREYFALAEYSSTRRVAIDEKIVELQNKRDSAMRQAHTPAGAREVARLSGLLKAAQKESASS